MNRITGAANNGFGRHQIDTDRVPPTHVSPGVAEGIVLIEQVPLALEKDQTVGVVHPLELTDTERSRWGEVMSDYEIVDTNGENISGCGFCGYRVASNVGHHRKTDWLKERYEDGLRFKVLRSRSFGDIGMIEYTPGNHSLFLGEVLAARSIAEGNALSTLDYDGVYLGKS